MQYVIKGPWTPPAPPSRWACCRVCQSKPVRGMPMPPSLIVTFGARRHRRDAAPPGGQHLVVLVGIGADPQQAANMVQDDGQVGDRPWQNPQALGAVGSTSSPPRTIPCGPARERQPGIARCRADPASCARPCFRPRDEGPTSPNGGCPGTGWDWPPVMLRAPGATRSPSSRLACPTMAAAARPGPYRPLALAAASPWTNSTSPTGRISSGPSARYMARASMNTVERTLWPLCISSASSWSR